ncbi:hypothetical protein, partial [Escherichia coli]
FQNHTNCPLTDLGGKTCIFSHPVYLFLREFSLQDSRGGSAPHTKNNLTIHLLEHPVPPVFDTKHASLTGNFAYPH